MVEIFIDRSAGSNGASGMVCGVVTPADIIVRLARSHLENLSIFTRAEHDAFTADCHHSTPSPSPGSRSGRPGFRNCAGAGRFRACRGRHTHGQLLHPPPAVKGVRYQILRRGLEHSPRPLPRDMQSGLTGPTNINPSQLRKCAAAVSRKRFKEVSNVILSSRHSR